MHDEQNKENKIACLVTLHSKSQDSDPQPQPPASLLVPRRVRRLVQQIHGKSADVPQEDTEQADRANQRDTDAREERTKPGGRSSW